jgi:hypothetical protein
VDQSLSGADLVDRGLADLAAGVESIEALLVSIGAPRLCALGFPVERPLADPERGYTTGSPPPTLTPRTGATMPSSDASSASNGRPNA